MGRRHVWETKARKARKKAKQRNWSYIKDLFNQVWQHSSNTQQFEQNFKYVSCQTEVKSLSDLLDRELNKLDVLFHLKTDLFHKAFLWNIQDHESIEASVDFPINENHVRKYGVKWEGSSKWFMSYAVISVIYKLLHCFFWNDFVPSPYCRPPDWYEHHKK